MEFTVQKLMGSIWSLEQQGVRAFLLVGQDRAVLVDTCFGGDILAACRTVTDAPVTLVTTHSDPDHTGCDRQFSKHCLHSAEFARYESRGNGVSGIEPLQEGDVIPVGEYRLEVLWIPGHTPGSIALLDREHRLLISGDTVQAGCVFMHGEGRDLRSFRDSLQRLNEMRREDIFDTVLPAHGEAVVSAEILGDQLALAEAVLEGSLAPAGPGLDWFADTVKTYRWGRAQMYYESGACE